MIWCSMSRSCFFIVSSSWFPYIEEQVGELQTLMNCANLHHVMCPGWARRGQRWRNGSSPVQGQCLDRNFSYMSVLKSRYVWLCMFMYGYVWLRLVYSRLWYDAIKVVLCIGRELVLGIESIAYGIQTMFPRLNESFRVIGIYLNAYLHKDMIGPVRSCKHKKPDGSSRDYIMSSQDPRRDDHQEPAGSMQVRAPSKASSGGPCGPGPLRVNFLEPKLSCSRSEPLNSSHLQISGWWGHLAMRDAAKK